MRATWCSESFFFCTSTSCLMSSMRSYLLNEPLISLVFFSRLLFDERRYALHSALLFSFSSMVAAWSRWPFSFISLILRPLKLRMLFCSAEFSAVNFVNSSVACSVNLSSSAYTSIVVNSAS